MGTSWGPPGGVGAIRGEESLDFLAETAETEQAETPVPFYSPDA